MFSFDLRSENPKKKNVEKGKKNENIDYGAPTLVWRGNLSCVFVSDCARVQVKVHRLPAIG